MTLNWLLFVLFLRKRSLIYVESKYKIIILKYAVYRFKVSEMIHCVSTVRRDSCKVMKAIVLPFGR